MGTKAKGNYPEPRAAVQKVDKARIMPPLDYDARWLPIEAAPALLAERTTALAIDLTDALLRGHLRCIRSAAGERKRVAASAWRYQLILWSGKDGLRVLRRPQPGRVRRHREVGSRLGFLCLETGLRPHSGRRAVRGVDRDDPH